MKMTTDFEPKRYASVWDAIEDDPEKRERLKRWSKRKMTPDLEPKRARRIRDKQRMKARARRIAKHTWSYEDSWLARAEKYADHIKCCSCWMCGNRRKHEGPPIRDLRAMADRRTGR